MTFVEALVTLSNDELKFVVDEFNKLKIALYKTTNKQFMKLYPTFFKGMPPMDKLYYNLDDTKSFKVDDEKFKDSMSALAYVNDKLFNGSIDGIFNGLYFHAGAPHIFPFDYNTSPDNYAYIVIALDEHGVEFLRWLVTDGAEKLKVNAYWNKKNFPDVTEGRMYALTFSGNGDEWLDLVDIKNYLSSTIEYLSDVKYEIYETINSLPNINS